MKTIKVGTWLPVFSGFYGTIWETDSQEEMEIGYINEDRRSKNLPEVNYDTIEWDYEGYRESVAKSVTGDIGLRLIDLGLVSAVVFEEVRSPREYNFANDSINVQFTLSPKNIKTIAGYLKEYRDEFATYLLERYTSYDGFISSYSNQAYDWTLDLNATLRHEHKLGSVLHFILLNEEGQDYEMRLYENASGNGAVLSASNYHELTKVA